MVRIHTCFFGVAVASVACALGACASSSSPSPAPAVDSGAASQTTANGTLAAFEELEALPEPRANHCSVVANGHLLVMGGNYKPAGAKDFVSTANVHAAQLLPNGQLGPWFLAGTMPGKGNSCTAAASDTQVFLLDGIYEDASMGGTVYRASIDAAGKLSAFVANGKLPEGVRVLYSSAVVEGDTLYTAFSRLPDNGDGVSLLSAKIDSGSALAFTETKWVAGFRGQPQYAFSSKFAYVMGGYGGAAQENTMLKTGMAVPLKEPATTSAFALPELPSAVGFGEAVVVDDWIFVVGGKDQIFTGKGSAATYAGRILPDGHVQSWVATAVLPQGRTSQSIAVGGDFLYVTGGGLDAGGLNNVYAARIRYPSK